MTNYGYINDIETVVQHRLNFASVENSLGIRRVSAGSGFFFSLPSWTFLNLTSYL